MAGTEAPAPPPDELYLSMNAWQLQCAARLQAEYGHSRDAAWSIAEAMRWDIEIGLRKPQLLIVITGI